VALAKTGAATRREAEAKIDPATTATRASEGTGETQTIKEMTRKVRSRISDAVEHLLPAAH
jgi:hypothetical protein